MDEFISFFRMKSTLRKKISAQPSQCRHDRLRRRRRSPGSPPGLRRSNFEFFHSKFNYYSHLCLIFEIIIGCKFVFSAE